MRHAQLPTTAVRIGVIVAAIAAVAAVASGGAAAADPADIDIVFVDDATDTDASGPLPPDYGTRGYVAVLNTTTGGTLAPSEVTFGGVPVDKIDRTTASVEGYVNDSDIPDDGLNVSVSVSGTQIGSTTIYDRPLDTDSATVNRSTLQDASNISVTVDGSEISDYESGFAGPAPPTSESDRRLTLYSEAAGMSAVRVAETNQTQSEILTNSSTAISDLTGGQQQWDDFTSVDEDPTTLYFSDAIEEIRIDGETVYEDSGPLGGGAGGGSTDNQLLILVVIGGAAALVLLSD